MTQTSRPAGRDPSRRVAVPTVKASAAMLVAIMSLLGPAPVLGQVEEPGFDVIVVGDGIGGLGAAVAAARLGASVAFFTFTGYPGGQASAGGVSTLDEGSPVLRQSGLYGELVEGLAARHGAAAIGGCYFQSTTLCPQPDLVAGHGRLMLEEAGVRIMDIYRRIDDVLQEGGTVNGVVIDGRPYRAGVVIDATERSDLYPLIEGLEWVVGGRQGCVQDMTWPVVLSWYPDGVPPELVVPATARDDLVAVWGGRIVESWLQEFRGVVVADPGRPTPPVGQPPFPWSFEEEVRYRAVADIRELPPDRPAQTRTVLNLANDAPLPIEVLVEGTPLSWEAVFRQALHRSYLYMWYLRYELGVTDWSVASDLGYDQAYHLDFDEAIPNHIEAHFPPLPYLREGRRLAYPQLDWGDLSDRRRRTDRFETSVMLGAYYTDFHGCAPLRRELSGYGLYEVPLGVFVPLDVDGFLPGLARAARVDRAAASSLRMQPTELLGGQVAGTIAALAVRRDERPRDVPASIVRSALRLDGAIVDMPDPRVVTPAAPQPACRPHPWSCTPGQAPD